MAQRRAMPPRGPPQPGQNNGGSAFGLNGLTNEELAQIAGLDARSAAILRFVDPRALYSSSSSASTPSQPFPTLPGGGVPGSFFPTLTDPNLVKTEPEDDILDDLDPFGLSMADNEDITPPLPGPPQGKYGPHLGPMAGNERSSTASDNEDGSPYPTSPPDVDQYPDIRIQGGIAPLSISPSSLPINIGRTNYSASMPTALGTRAKPIAFPAAPTHRASFASSVPDGSYGSFGDLEEGGSSVERGGGSRKTDTASKRRRRESHNAVERRRRDTINLQIQELCDLLPLELVPSVGPGQAPGSKPNKGSVLRRGVDYIRMLQNERRALEQRCKDLELFMASLGIQAPPDLERRDTEMQDQDEMEIPMQKPSTFSKGKR